MKDSSERTDILAGVRHRHRLERALGRLACFFAIALPACSESDGPGQENLGGVRWYLYPEAGTLGAGARLSASEGLVTQVSLPQGATGKLHVILDARDDGNPNLSAYRRVIVDVTN